MTASVLTVKNDGTPVQVYTMVGTTLAQLGDDLTASTETGIAAGDLTVNRVINAFGDVYACVDDGVYKLQSGSSAGVWSKELIDGGLPYTSQGAGDTNWQVGPYFKVVNNEPILFGAYASSASSTQIRTWNLNLLTGATSISADINVSSSRDLLGAQMMYNGQLYLWYNGDFSRWVIINPDVSPPSASTATSGASNALSGKEVAFDVFNGKLLASGRAASNGFSDLYQFDAGTFTNLFSVVSSNIADSGTTRRRAMFNDGTNAYVITPGASTWRMFQIDEVAGTLQLGSELTIAVLPPAVQAINAGFWTSYQNQLSDGSSEVLLFFINGGTVTQYRFVDVNTQLELEDSATSTTSVVLAQDGGGARAFIEDGPNITIHARERVAGGEKVTFRAFGGQISQFVRFFFGTDHEVPMTQAQLIGVATGGTSVRNGNQIESISADGLTDYTITIQPVGFDDLDRIELVARISSS